jgi:hypothetical protein
MMKTFAGTLFGSAFRKSSGRQRGGQQAAQVLPRRLASGDRTHPSRWGRQPRGNRIVQNAHG